MKIAPPDRTNLVDRPPPAAPVSDLSFKSMLLSSEAVAAGVVVRGGDRAYGFSELGVLRRTGKLASGASVETSAGGGASTLEAAAAPLSLPNTPWELHSATAASPKLRNEVTLAPLIATKVLTPQSPPHAVAPLLTVASATKTGVAPARATPAEVFAAAFNSRMKAQAPTPALKLVSFDADGRLQVTAAAPLTPAEIRKLHKEISDLAIEFGLTLAEVTLNGVVIGSPTPVTRRPPWP